MAISVVELEESWQRDPRGARRAMGGRYALGGFSFQLASSASRFVELLEEGAPEAAVAFEGLSDLTVYEPGVLYLIQMKTTLDDKAARSAALEALAIDDFLAREYPELRETASFSLQCLRSTDADPRDLTGEQLRLDAPETRRWEHVKQRMLAPIVRGDPYLELVARLFPRTEDAPGLASTMIGDLMRRLGENQSSAEIALALAERIAAARQRLALEPPGNVLVAEAFRREPAGRGVLLGQRPTLGQLRGGWFMDREAATSQFARAVLNAFEQDADDGALPVVWLGGTSGAGKSVLLLQTMERLVEKPECVVHHVPGSTSAFRDALRYWANSTASKVVIAIDDLYAPARRGLEAWDQIAAEVLGAEWAGRVVLLTTGPPEYESAFLEHARRDGGFRIIPVTVEGLSPVERERYRDWHSGRTGIRTAAVSDTIFAVAALRAESNAGGDDGVAQFAQRFIDRCRGAGIGQPVQIVLAMNRVGLPGPETLFTGYEQTLARLVNEEAIQRGDEPDTAGQLTVFHQRIAALIYDAIVPPDETAGRAADLVAGAAALEPGDPTRQALFGLLQRGRHGDGGDTFRQLLADGLWTLLWREGNADYSEAVPWLFAARKSDVALDQATHGARLVSWLFAPGTPGRAVAPCWQELWRLFPGLRPQLERKALEWLEDRETDPDWALVCRRLLLSGRLGESPLEKAVVWLAQRPEADGWVELFLAVDNRRRQPTDVARDGLRSAPLSDRDPHLWASALRAGVPPRDIVAMLVRRLCRDPRKAVVAAAGAFIRETRAISAEMLQDALTGEADQPSWPRVVRTLMSSGLAADQFAAIRRASIAWLGSHLDDQEWVSTWIATYRASAGSSRSRAELRRIADQWLAGHREDPKWLLVVSLLSEDAAALAAPHADWWLAERPDHGSWPWLWLTVQEFLPDHGRSSARAWLIEASGHRLWPKVFAATWGGDGDDGDLVGAGAAWLESQWKHRGWLAVFEPIYQAGARDELRPAALRWLRNSHVLFHPGWWRVICALPQGPIDAEVVANALQWVHFNPHSVGAPLVLTRLLEADPAPRVCAAAEIWARRVPARDEAQRLLADIAAARLAGAP